MSCQKVQKSVSAFLDHSLAREERAGIEQHLSHCRQCAAHTRELLRVSSLMRDLPAVEVPPAVETRLRVLASHERVRYLSRVSFAARCRHWRAQAKLLVNNLMRPVALPLAGGLFSALFLFGMLVPTLNFHHNLRDDVPTQISYTEPTLEEMGPFAFSNDDMLVEFTINEKGQIVDYSIPQGSTSPALASNLANIVLFASFTPATFFGQPTSGKVIVSFRRSHIVVRG